jgi:SecD/SecF fusion protein
MLIGVVTGTYSSIFVAAPILVDFAKNRALGKKEKK